MYSASNIAVDKGLGFDFSDISNLVKTALPAGLQIFSQQMQLNALKKNPNAGMPVYGGYQQQQMYGQPYNTLPMTNMGQPQRTFPGPYVSQSQGMDSTTMVLIGGGVLVAGLILFKALK